MPFIIAFLVAVLLSAPVQAGSMGAIGTQMPMEEINGNIDRAKAVLARLSDDDFLPLEDVEEIYRWMVDSNIRTYEFPCMDSGLHRRLLADKDVCQCIVWPEGGFDVRVTKASQRPTELGTVYSDDRIVVEVDYVFEDGVRVRENVELVKNSRNLSILVRRL